MIISRPKPNSPTGREVEFYAPELDNWLDQQWYNTKELVRHKKCNLTLSGLRTRLGQNKSHFDTVLDALTRKFGMSAEQHMGIEPFSKTAIDWIELHQLMSVGSMWRKGLIMQATPIRSNK